MGTLISVGWVVMVKGVVLQHYRTLPRASKRCRAERDEGVPAQVFECWVSSALGERE